MVREVPLSDIVSSVSFSFVHRYLYIKFYCVPFTKRASENVYLFANKCGKHLHKYLFFDSRSPRLSFVEQRMSKELSHGLRILEKFSLIIA